MRVSEMYLIEAEALAQQGQAGPAAAALKLLMDNRDPQWGAANTSVTADQVFQQKRIELWGEGKIFYDYLRLKKGVDRTYVDPPSNHMEQIAVPAGSWRFIYNIPQAEIDNNNDLTDDDQNPMN